MVEALRGQQLVELLFHQRVLQEQPAHGRDWPGPYSSSLPRVTPANLVVRPQAASDAVETAAGFGCVAGGTVAAAAAAAGAAAVAASAAPVTAGLAASGRSARQGKHDRSSLAATCLSCAVGARLAEMRHAHAPRCGAWVATTHHGQRLALSSGAYIAARLQQLLHLRAVEGTRNAAATRSVARSGIQEGTRDR